MYTTPSLPKPQGRASPIIEPRADIALSPDLLEDWQALLDTLAGMLAADGACIRRVHHQTTEILLSTPALATTFAPRLRRGERLPFGPDMPAFCRPVVDTGRPFAIEDAQKDPSWERSPDRVAGFRAYYGQPLRLSDKTLFGVLELYFETPRQMPYIQRRCIQQVAAAINARLFFLTGCHRLRKEADGRRKATEELRRSERKRELEAVNATQEKLIGIIARDVHGSVASLSDRLRELVEGHPGNGTAYGEPRGVEGPFALPEVLDQAEAANRPKAPDRPELAELAEDAANTRALLEELMLWSRCQRGGFECRCQMIELSFAVDECLGLLAPMAKRKSIQLEADIPRGIHVLTDADMLQTSLRQIVTNAIKFTPAGGHVFVETTRQNGDVTLTIRDDGQGIDPGVQQRLFQSGPGVSTPGTRNERGTGFGLAICKDLTEQSGGELWLESEEGLGTKVCLRFQGAKEEPESPGRQCLASGA